jgi:hypothetical protein
VNPQNQLLIEQLGNEVVKDLFCDGVQGGRNLFETWLPPVGSAEGEALMDFTQAEKAEAKRIVEQAVGLDVKSLFGLGVTFGRVIGRRDAKKSLLEDTGDEFDDLSIMADQPTSKKRLLTEQQRVELCESLGIPKGGYEDRNRMVLEELQKQTGDESVTVVELFGDRVIYESRKDIFQSGYSLIDGDSVELLDTVRLEGTAAKIKEQLRADRKKHLFERKVAGLRVVKPVKVDESGLNPQQQREREMAGFVSGSEKRKSLLLEQSAVDESTLTKRQIRDRKIAGLM